MRRITGELVASYADLAHMLVRAAGFVLLYHATRVRSVLRFLVPFGRMSLTCYVSQALFWVPIYYNFGFGLYRYMGPFYSVMAGAGFFVAQLMFAHAWMKRFHYGPLEWLWRSATLGTTKVPFRRTASPVPAAFAPV